MQFSDITNAVHDAWTFVWPPVFIIFLVYLSSRWLSRENTDRAISYLWAWIKFSSTRLESYRSVLEVYGLAKLIPAISVISVICVLYILNGPVMQIVSNLPPYVSHISERVVADRDEEDRLLILRKYPAADSFSEAYAFAYDQFAMNKEYQERRYYRGQFNYKILNFIKFTFTLFLILSIVHILNGASFFVVFFRLIAGLTLVAVLWIVSFSVYLYDLEQGILDDWRQIQMSLQPEAKELLNEPVTEKEKDILKNRSMGFKERWWQVSLYNSYYITWSKRTFFDEGT